MDSRFEDVFKRIENAKGGFAERLMEQGGIDAATAKRLTEFYLKKKLAKLEVGVGQMRVTHGGFWAKEAIGRAVIVMNGGKL